MSHDLITAWNQQGIEFSLGNGGKLKVNANKSVLTSEVTARLRVQKAEILAALKQQKLQQLDTQFQTSVANRTEILHRLNLAEEDIVGFYPLVPLQEGMLLQHLLNEERDPYIAHFVLKIQGKDTYEKVLSSFKAVNQRHASCRTAIIWRNVDRAFQLVRKQVNVPVTQENFTGAEQCDARLKELKSQPRKMDLESDPLTRIHVLVNDATDEHLLFIERHHIVSDHISLEITLFELLKFFRQEQTDLPKARQQYEFSLEQANLSSAEISYFETLLADFQQPSLLGDVKQTHIQSGDMEKCSLHITGENQKQLRQQVRKLGVSPAAVFHFAWSMVMAKYCDSNDILFASVYTGRMTSPDYQATIGMFLNSLPCRITLTDETVAQQLQRLNLQLLQSAQFEHVPLDKAIQTLSQEFSTVFNCLFNFRHSNEDELMGALPFEYLSSKTESSSPFTLSITDTSEDFVADLEAVQGSCPTALLDSLKLALDYIVQQLLQSQQQAQPFRMPALLSEQQQNYLLQELNNMQLDYKKDSLIHQLFEAQAAATPGKVALVFGEQHLTFAELNQRANQLASYLKSHYGVAPDELVAICLQRSFDVVIAILAVLKSGGAYVPMDPSYPAKRLNAILHDATPKVLLSRSEIAISTTMPSDSRVDLDNADVEQALAQIASDNLSKGESTASAENLAYVIYTSGSTGEPKGVMIQHCSLTNFSAGFDAQINACSQSLDGGWLWLSSFQFDASLKGLCLLAKGTPLVIPSVSELQSPKDIVALIKREGIGIINATPQLLDVLVRESDLPCVDLISSGENIGAGRLSLFQAFVHKAGTHLLNAYGPTETTINSSFANLTQAESETIGMGTANTQLLVFNRDMSLTPDGAIGELYIAGDGVARGYLNRPEQTADAFVDNTFYRDGQIASYKRQYRSGDLVKRLPDGNLVFVSRRDQQVKIRGYRIESGEIEGKLSELDAVDSALVVASELAGAMQLVAYVKPEIEISGSQQSDFVEQLKLQLNETLPDYMMPCMVIVVADWPKLPNGKLDRNALPTPNQTAFQDNYVAPVTDTEKTVVHQVAALTGVTYQHISTEAHLLNFGFNSILSLRLSQGLAAEFDIEAPLALVLEASSIKELALELDFILSINTEAPSGDLVEEEW